MGFSLPKCRQIHLVRVFRVAMQHLQWLNFKMQKPQHSYQDKQQDIKDKTSSEHNVRNTDCSLMI